ncbi:MAG: cobalamin B12-binding domain-containing protein [Gammaproteobacteria bacterium]|nr:cobalamin B12-binding domain-containing protein [Gammaproteobacteria bacterium]
MTATDDNRAAPPPHRGRTAPIRVLIAKPGLDGHDQGAKVVVRGLMDAGFEVIYSGLRQTPEAVARIAQDEDVDVIGLSSLAGSHLPFCRRLRDLLHEYRLDDRLWLVGGNIPAADCAPLRELGIAGIFPTGSRLADIARFIREHVT